MINGVIQSDRPNIGFTNNHSRRFTKGKKKPMKRKSDEMINKLKSDGLLSGLTFKSKYCFFVGKLNSEEKTEFGKLTGYLTESELTSQSDDKNYKMSQNWWTFEKEIDDASTTEMSTILDKYLSFQDAKERCKFNVYGTIDFGINLSGLNLVKDDNDNSIVKYPYGAIFFGDSKNSRDMIKGKVACVPSCAETLIKEKNDYFAPIEDSLFNINGVIKTNGRLCIFYVDGEESDDDGVEMYPSIKVVEILVSVIRNKSNSIKNGFIEKMFVSRVEQNEVVVEDVADYVLTIAFAKNETEINKDTIIHNAADYIWMIGKNYTDYNISEEGFVERRSDLGLEASQLHIGEEYRKQASKNKPKKFTKVEPEIKVSNIVEEDQDDTVTDDKSSFVETSEKAMDEKLAEIVETNEKEAIDDIPGDEAPIDLNPEGIEIDDSEETDEQIEVDVDFDENEEDTSEPFEIG